jgi:hypothetical protein
MKNLTKIEPETKLLEHMPTGELNKTKLKWRYMEIIKHLLDKKWNRGKLLNLLDRAERERLQDVLNTSRRDTQIYR